MHAAILGVKRGENEGGESGRRRLLLAGVCAPVTAVAVGRVGYHAHREEEPPPVDHSHGRRRQAAAASLEASDGARWHRRTPQEPWHCSTVRRRRKICSRPRHLVRVRVRGSLLAACCTPPQERLGTVNQQRQFLQCSIACYAVGYYAGIDRGRRALAAEHSGCLLQYSVRLCCDAGRRL